MKTPDTNDKPHIKIKALKKEYEVLCNLRDKGVPNVVHAVDMCYYFDNANNKLPALIMTLAKGESIATWMLKGPISEDDTLDIGKKSVRLLWDYTSLDISIEISNLKTLCSMI